MYQISSNGDGMKTPRQALAELIAAHDACASADIAFNEQLKKFGGANAVIPSPEAIRLGAAWYDAREALSNPSPNLIDRLQTIISSSACRDHHELVKALQEAVAALEQK